MKKRFGELLLERGLINAKQLVQALELQQRRGLRLGTALVSLGSITETQLVEILGTELGFPVIELAQLTPQPEALALIAYRLAYEHDLLPVELRTDAHGRRTLLVAMADPLNARLIDELSFVADVIVQPMLATATSIRAAVEQSYAVSSPSEQSLSEQSPSPGRPVPPGVEVVMGRPASNAQGLSFTGTPIATGAQPFALPEEAYSSAGALDESRAAIIRTQSGSFQANPASLQDYYGHGLFDGEGGVLQADEVRQLERKVWALLRVLVKKGVISKDEILAELDRSGG